MAKECSHNRHILSFDQGIVIGLAGAGLVKSINSLPRSAVTR